LEVYDTCYATGSACWQTLSTWPI